MAHNNSGAWRGHGHHGHDHGHWWHGHGHGHHGHWGHFHDDDFFVGAGFFGLGLFFGGLGGYWWDAPIYYDYGPGGTVYYEGPYAYVGDTPVATREEWVNQAYDLADVNADDLTPIQTETTTGADQTSTLGGDIAENWKPLGVYMLVREDSQQQTTLYLQLAVSKNGEIGGTYHNDAKNTTLNVAGRIDPKTQRVAFHVGDDKETIVETGVYNLTLGAAPVQIHFGREKTENWLLIRQKETSAAGEKTTYHLERRDMALSSNRRLDE